MKKSKVITGTEVYPVSRTGPRIVERRFGNSPKDVYWTGTIPTHHGFVDFYRQKGEAAHTVLRFAINGQIHARTYNYAMTDRYAITAARRFANEVMQENRRAKGC